MTLFALGTPGCKAPGSAAAGGARATPGEDRLLQVTWDGRSCRLPVRVRYSGEALIVLLHGLGCSSESFSGAFTSASLLGYSICAFDFPGHGQAASLLAGTLLEGPADFLPLYAGLTRQVVRQARRARPGISHVFLVGHSMGGAVGVIAASDSGDIAGLVNADGNLVAEDCGIVSRRLAGLSLSEFLETGFPGFLAELRGSGRADLGAWARWCSLASPVAVHQAARSLVHWSDSGRLLELFNKIPARAYLHGGTDDREYIVRQLKPAPVLVAGVRDSGHFAMIDNATGFYDAVSLALAGMR